MEGLGTISEARKLPVDSVPKAGIGFKKCSIACQRPTREMASATAVDVTVSMF